MKAFLLAAGLGTRLRPLTDSLPKCLVPIAGRPLLAYWLDLLATHGISEVLINTHHHASQVHDFIADYPTALQVKLVHEETLLGSAGTLTANREWVGQDQDVLIAYADNLTDADLTSLIREHRASDALLTMALYESPDPSQCGIATLDAFGVVVRFEEKPAQPDSSLANAGIYVASREVFDLLPDRQPADIAFDLLPRLVGRMRGLNLNAYLLDVGTPERYRRAQQDARQLFNRQPNN